MTLDAITPDRDAVAGQSATKETPPMENKKYSFISGLPRSGSTLLSAILAQNPDIHAGMSSPAGALMSVLRSAMSTQAEISSLVDDEARFNILRGVFDGYYRSVTRPLVFDTNRRWTGRIPELNTVFHDQDVRIIALVRNPAWVFDSVERIIQKNPLRQSMLANPHSTIKSRAENMMSDSGLIGSAMGNLLAGVSGPHARQILLVEYDALCCDPAATLDAIYKFLGIEKFDHDFSWVEYRQDSFDAALMTPDLHTVSGPVEVKQRKTVLPPDIFRELSQAAFWKTDFQSEAPRVICQNSALAR